MNFHIPSIEFSAFRCYTLTGKNTQWEKMECRADYFPTSS